MFVETCQRLRLMKGSEAVNLGTYMFSPKAYLHVFKNVCFFFTAIAVVHFHSTKSRPMRHTPLGVGTHARTGVLKESGNSAGLDEDLHVR